MESIPSPEEITVTVERAQPDDAEEIQNVFYKTWLATYPNMVPGVTIDDVHEYYKEAYDPEKIEKYQKRITESFDSGDQKYFIAKINNKVVGVCIVLKLQEKNQLKAIYILPKSQGKGIGYKLWNEALKFIDQTKDTTVEVVIYNKKTIEFYEQLGFEDTGKRWTDEKFKMKSGATFPEMEMKIKGTDSSK